MTNEILNLLQEYEDLFPSLVADLKGIKGDLGEMWILLKPDARPVKHRPYQLNPRIKEKFKLEIDKMPKAGLILPVEESEWVSPIIIQNKKDKSKICVCVDYQSLNNAYIHEPFPTPFSDEVLENVAGNEAYSFTDGFLGYHQAHIEEEDKMKMTFTTEWGVFCISRDVV